MILAQLFLGRGGQQALLLHLGQTAHSSISMSVQLFGVGEASLHCLFSPLVDALDHFFEPVPVDPQSAWAGLVAPLLASRPSVQVLMWNQLADNEPHEFPHGGLFDERGKAKDTLSVLRELRKSSAT